MTEVDKNIVGLSIYQIKENLQLCAYTALWCGPCKRIKPKLIELMTDYKIIEEKNIEKAFFKKEVNEFVPFFVILKNGEKVDSIQTSDEMLFTQFLSRNGISTIVLGDDF